MNRPRDLRPLEKHGEDFASRTDDPGVAGPDTTYSQHKDTPTPESNPAGNPHHMISIDREHLLANLDKLDNVDLVRLSRSSYLLHANRYNVSIK